MSITRPTRESVEAAVAAAFPAEDASTVMAVLERYGLEPHEPERERVQLAIVALSRGDVDRLLEAVAAAKRDYRNVLLWTEYAEQAQAMSQTEVERLLEQLERGESVRRSLSTDEWERLGRRLREPTGGEQPTDCG